MLAPLLLNAQMAALPYVRIPELGPIKPFGVLVVIGILTGAHLANRRAEKLGLDAEKFSSLVFWTVFSGILISHVLDTIAYYPRTVLERPWELFMFWRGLSSFGGFTGAALGFWFFGRKYKIDLWRAADSIAYGLPVGWFFGRMGCASVHDHPGRFSSSIFAVAYPEGARFDLGLLEMALTPLLILLVIIVARRTTRPGAVVTTLALSYPWLRFPLDFLRAGEFDGGDIRYFGFTPGQYWAVAMLAFGIFLLVRSRRVAAREREAAAAGAKKSSGRTRAEKRA